MRKQAMTAARVAGWTVILMGSFLSRWGPVAADAAGPIAVHELSPQEAASHIRQHGGSGDFVLLDVRTPNEYREEHLQGAVSIDFLSGSFRQDLERLERGKTYLVYCRTGNRSGKAVSTMKELRFPNVLHMSGGILKWKEAGLPTVR
jgi:rhodanese-related sulfurtransferase